MQLIGTLAMNMLIVIVVSVIGSSLVLATHRKSSDWVWGLVFGVAVVLTMATAVHAFQGWVIDYHSVILALAGYAGGMIPVLVTATIAIVYRLLIGGEAVWAGVLTIVLYAGSGLVLRRLNKPMFSPTILSLFLFGVFLALIKISVTLLSAGVLPAGWAVLRSINAPALVFTPIGTVIVFRAFFALRKQVTHLAALEAALNAMPVKLLARESPGVWLSLSKGSGAEENERKAISEIEASPWGLVGDREGSVAVSEGLVDYSWELMDFFAPQGRQSKLILLDEVTATRKASRQLELFFELSSEGMLIMTPSGIVLRANQAWRELLGERGNFGAVSSLWDLLDPSGTVLGRDRLAKLWEEGGRVSCVLLVEQFGGSVKWVAGSFVVQKDEGRIFAMLRDVTEDINQEDQLLLQAEMLREQAELLEAAHDAIILYSPSGKIEYWNEGAERTYGWHRNEVLGADHGTLFAVNEQEHHRLHIALAEKDHWRGELIRHRQGGSSIIVDCDIAACRDPEGRRDGVLEIGRDVTARTESRLADGRLAVLVLQSSNAIVATKLDGSILTWNSAASKMLGYNMTDVLEKCFGDYVAHDKDLWRRLYQQIHAGQSPGVVTTELRHSNGSTVRVAVTLSPLRHPPEVPYGVVLVIRDLSTEERLSKAFARLDRLNYVGQLARGIGHELRNPLTTVRGFLQLFAGRTELSAHTSKFRLLLSEMDRVNDLLTEFMTLSSSRHVALERRQLNDVVQSLWPAMQGEAEPEKKAVNLALNDLPEINLGEREIRALVMNLVRNALEASASGQTVTVSTSRAENGVMLSVTDNGTGISAQHQEHIGTPFFTTKKFGTGMGLAVCYSIAKLHHATISFVSGEDGTVFHVLFPTASSQ